MNQPLITEETTLRMRNRLVALRASLAAAQAQANQFETDLQIHIAQTGVSAHGGQALAETYTDKFGDTIGNTDAAGNGPAILLVGTTLGFMKIPASTVPPE